tara:strand:+ start:320 stop:589 length:270 start_codon:yes stop_codon:yes gene_type:complete
MSSTDSNSSEENIKNTNGYIPVENNQYLFRDSSSKAIINTNRKEYLRALKRKQDRTIQLNEMDKLKNEVADIKSMLTQILEKVGSNGTN